MIETKFKDTELGMIPEDWESGKFQDFLATFSSGATPGKSRDGSLIRFQRIVTDQSPLIQHIYIQKMSRWVRCSYGKRTGFVGAKIVHFLESTNNSEDFLLKYE